MTNREYINTLSPEDFAAWLCRNIFLSDKSMEHPDILWRIYTSAICDFLKIEHTEEGRK